MTPEQIRRVGAMRRLAACGAARTLRLERRFSLREMAVLVGASASTLSRWETGASRPRPDAALRWANALDIPEESA